MNDFKKLISWSFWMLRDSGSYLILGFSKLLLKLSQQGNLPVGKGGAYEFFTTRWDWSSGSPQGLQWHCGGMFCYHEEGGEVTVPDSASTDKVGEGWVPCNWQVWQKSRLLTWSSLALLQVRRGGSSPQGRGRKPWRLQRQGMAGRGTCYCQGEVSGKA